MISLELRFKSDGQEISFEHAVDYLASRLAEKMSSAIRNSALAPPTQIVRPPERPGVQPKAVSIGDAAKLLGIKASTIRAYTGQRRIRFIRIGRRVLIPMGTINQILEEGLPKHKSNH